MTSSDRLQRLLSLFRPLNELESGYQNTVKANRLNFPDPDNQMIRKGLSTLGVPQLSDYLIYIPYERFKIEELGRGGFATVWKGTVEPLDERGLVHAIYYVDNRDVISYTSTPLHFALKEIDADMNVELALHTYLTSHAEDAVSPIMPIIGLSQQNFGDYKYLLAAHREELIEQDDSNEFEFADGAFEKYTSRFYSHQQLLQISQRHTLESLQVDSELHLDAENKIFKE
ncbi:hypothetical protein BC938DRAFT_481037 [Jimgerdemannia flammicorona]|uniref:Uncharacterized protein n=1 Tax=Jimgerdemannia flammicorona TaxID=994334 RepID=A0A433QH89_9FUNG|nr:hypothetical protein BC938DRAFT_481037 [Jimgerdemannia flammicorona]